MNKYTRDNKENKTGIKEVRLKSTYLVSVASIANARTVRTLPRASSATAVDLAT